MTDLLLADAVPSFRAGDVLAFSGTGLISDLVKVATGSHISHVGLALGDGLMIESTSLNGFTGVTESPVTARLLEYEGRIWWYPLRPQYFLRYHAYIRQVCAKLVGEPYDTWGALEAAFQIHHDQHQGDEFCSELAAQVLRDLDVLPASVEPDLVLPCGLLNFDIFSTNFEIIR